MQLENKAERPVLVTVIQYLTIASTGNMQDFGDLSVAQERPIGVQALQNFSAQGGMVLVVIQI